MPFAQFVTADLVLLLTALAMPAVSAYADQRWLRIQPPAGKHLLRRYVQLIARGWVVVAIFAVIWSAQNRSFALVGLPIPPTWRDYLGFALVGAALLGLPFQLSRLARLSHSQLMDAVRQVDAIQITPDNWTELGVFMLVAVTAGVWEELIYRGFLLWYLTPGIGVGGAVIISSLLFGMGHAYQGPQGVVTTTALGLAFCLFFLASGSLWWLMAVHAAIDVHGGFVSFRIKRIAARRRGRAADIAGRIRQRL